MAVTHQITDGTTTIDLTTAVGFKAERDFAVTFADPTGDGSIPPYVTEAIPIHVYATSDNNLATTMQDFHALQRRAVQYWVDPMQRTPVWYHRKLDAETTAVRSLVKSMHFTFDTRLHGVMDEMPEISEGRDGMLSITHHPHGESPTVKSASASTPSAAASLSYDYTTGGTGDVVGDVHARVHPLRLAPIAGDNLEEAWVGVRGASKHGVTPANFIGVWECEAGTNITDAVDDAASEVNTASPGGGSGAFVKVTPTGADYDNIWSQAMEITLQTARGAQTAADQVGEFLWVLRMKCDSGDDWQVQMRFGYSGMGNDDYVRGEIVSLTNNLWYYYPTGICSIPLRDARVLTTSDLAFTFEDRIEVQIWAKFGTTGANLYLDCFCPVPIDEGFLHITGATASGNSNDTVWAGVSPHDLSAGIVATATGIDDVPAVEPVQWGVPPGDGRLIIVKNSTATQDVFTDRMTINCSWYPRWLSLRGGE